jgi:hypothetical protein
LTLCHNCTIGVSRGVPLHRKILGKGDLLLQIRRIQISGWIFFIGTTRACTKNPLHHHRRSPPPSLNCSSCAHHTLPITTMKSAIATLALAASVSAFAPAPVTKSSTALNDVWDSYSEFFSSSEILKDFVQLFGPLIQLLLSISFPLLISCVPNLYSINQKTWNTISSYTTLYV